MSDKTPFQRVVDDLTDGCGCGCHTGIGYNTACWHCQSQIYPPERSAGAAPIAEPLKGVGHILAHYAIEDADWEALRPFIRSAGAAPLDVERLAEALVLVTREVLFRGDRDAANWRHKTAENLAAAYARLSERTDR